MGLKEIANDLFNRVKKGTKEEVKLPHYAQTREELGKPEFAGFYMPPEDIEHLKLIFEEGKGLTKPDLEAKIYDLFEGGTEERKKYIDLIIKPGEKHYFAVHDVETKKHIQDVFFTPGFEISAVVYGRVVPKKHTLVKVYKRIPNEVFDAWNPYLKDMKELYEQAKKEVKPLKGIGEVEKEVEKTPEKVKPNKKPPKELIIDGGYASEGQLDDLRKLLPGWSYDKETRRFESPDKRISMRAHFLVIDKSLLRYKKEIADILRGFRAKFEESTEGLPLSRLEEAHERFLESAKPLADRLNEIIMGKLSEEVKPLKEIILYRGVPFDWDHKTYEKDLWTTDSCEATYYADITDVAIKADKTGYVLKISTDTSNIVKTDDKWFRLKDIKKLSKKEVTPALEVFEEHNCGKVKTSEITTPPAIEEEEIGIPESTFKALLERLKYTLSLTALYKKTDEFPWAEMSDEQMLAMTEAIERRKNQIITEQKHRVYYEDVLKRIQEATTDEDLESIRIEVEQSGLTNTAKEVVMNEIERKKKKEVPVVTPLEPAEAPLSTEVEEELRYLEMQRGFGQKMHPQIEYSLKRLEEYGYPKEKIAELRIKFEPV